MLGENLEFHAKESRLYPVEYWLPEWLEEYSGEQEEDIHSFIYLSEGEREYKIARAGCGVEGEAGSWLSRA